MNKDHDHLPQINLALLFGEASRLPVYYVIFHGALGARNRRTCIGKLDPVTEEIIPSKKSVYEEALLPKPGPVPSLVCKRSFFGATYLFDAIGEKLGITEDLKRCFPESYKQLR